MIGLIILFTLAGALSSVWLGTAFLYVGSRMSWDAFLALPPPDLALYLCAVFGPLAALWLILGFFYIAAQGQRQEQVLQTLAGQARRNAEQTEAQVRTLIEMQAESRRRSMLGGMDLVIKDMNGQAALLAERLGMVSEPEADSLWARTVSGDLWAFAHAFLIRAAAYPDFADMLAERLAGDQVCSAALQTFLRRYDQLSEGFRENEADRLMRQVLEDGPLARLQVLFADVNARAIRLRMLWAASETGAASETAGNAWETAAGAAADGSADMPEVYPVPEFQPPHAAPAHDAPMQVPPPVQTSSVQASPDPSYRRGYGRDVAPVPAAPPVGDVPAGVAAIAVAAAGMVREDEMTGDWAEDPAGFGDEHAMGGGDGEDPREPEDLAREFLQQLRRAEAEEEAPVEMSEAASATEPDTGETLPDDPAIDLLPEEPDSLKSSMSRLNDALRRLNGDAGTGVEPSRQGDLLSGLASDPAQEPGDAGPSRPVS